MDNLAREAMLARQAGMSYGKWKALQPPQEERPKELPKGWKKCECCGKPFKMRQGKRFCEIDCRTKAYEARRRIMNADYYRSKKAKMA